MKKLCFLLLVSIAAFAADRVTLATPGKIARVSDPQIAPDGKSIAVVVTRSNYAENRNDADIVLVDVATHAQHVIVTGRRAVSSPRWSEDGSRLAFLAQVDGKGQIHVLAMAGGETAPEVRQVTKAPTGVQSFTWRPDGKAFAFNAFDEAPKVEGEERFNKSFEVQDNHFLTTEAPKPSHVWLVASDGATPARRLTSGTWTLPVAFPPGPPPAAPQWSADGKTLAIVKHATVYSGDFDQATIQLMDAESGAMHPMTARAKNEGHPEYSPDGKWIAYWYPHEGQTKYGMDIYIAPAAGGEGKPVTAALDRNILRAIWTPDSKALLVAANDHTTTGLWIQPVDGSPAKHIDAGKVVAGGGFGLDASISRDGRIALAASEPLHPSELYYMSSGAAKPERITDFNASIAAMDLGRTESITWTNEGFAEDGVVTYPPDFQQGHKYPLVLYIHGGPRSASKEAFSSRAQLLAAQGWLVFEPNYRGSDNLGNKYQAGIWNDAGAGPGRDVMAGLEVLKKRGIVDESRMAVSGWSYGGYMTTWMMGHYPTLWKAAVAGAPVTDWMDQYNFSDANVRRASQLGGSPYTDAKRMQAYIDQSPITMGPKMRTPTLILQNTGDYRVTPTQAYKLYHVLRDNGVPVKFFAYPLVGHNAADPVHMRDVDRRWVDWLKPYLQ